VETVLWSDAGLPRQDSSRLKGCKILCIILCMATKTISLDLEAYEKLRSMKKPSESFSDLVKRLASGQKTVKSFRRAWIEMDAGTLPSIEELDKLDSYLRERPAYVPPRHVVSD